MPVKITKTMPKAVSYIMKSFSDGAHASRGFCIKDMQAKKRDREAIEWVWSDIKHSCTEKQMLNVLSSGAPIERPNNLFCVQAGVCLAPTYYIAQLLAVNGKLFYIAYIPE
jgi:hypothetical protein